MEENIKNSALYHTCYYTIKQILIDKAWNFIEHELLNYVGKPWDEVKKHFLNAIKEYIKMIQYKETEV